MSTRKPSPKKAESYIAYFRISKKGGTGLGMEAQREAVGRAAGGTPILTSYTEEESGKKHTNRPQLLAAIEECKRKHSTLLIAKLDRLVRNVHFISGLMESNISFVACDMPDANKLTLHIMASMAEHERESISDRTRAALESVKREIEEKGFRISRTGHRFTKLGNPRWEEALAKARAVQQPPAPLTHLLEIMQRHRVRGESLRAIAERLNELGLKTPARKHWYASTVRAAMLRRPGSRT